MEKENIIKGKCTTNLDNFDVSMIKGFARVPNVGERINGLYNGTPRSLKICDVIHDFKDGEPYIIVEVNR